MYIVNQSQIDNIYNLYLNFECYSFEGSTIIDPSIDIGDILIIDGKKIIYQGDLSYVGKLKIDIKSTIKSKQKEDTSVKTISQKVINRRVKSNINQIDGKIATLVQEQTEQSKKLTKTEQDLDSITQRVESTETNVADVQEELELKGTFTKQKEIQIECAEAVLQDVQIFGESTQDSEPSIDSPSPITSIKSINYKVTGKNIFDGEMELGSINWINGQLEDNTNCIRSKNYTQVVAGEYYSFSNNRNYSHNIYSYDNNKQFIKAEGIANDASYKIPENAKNIKFRTTQGTVENNLDTIFQIEKGNKTTEIKEYKENSQIINMPTGIGLCSLNNGTQDYIDNTGIVHKVIKKVVYNGTETWSHGGESATTTRFLTPTADLKLVRGWCDKLGYKYTLEYNMEVEAYSTTTYTGYIYIAIKKERLLGYDTNMTATQKVNLFKEFLKNNNITLYYATNTEETIELADTERLKLQNLKTLKGINNISINAPTSVTYYRNVNLNDAFETRLDATNKYAEIKSTTDKITNTVAETNSYIDNSVISKIVSTEQSIEGLKYSLQQTGGQNLIKNSTLKFGLSKNVTTTGTVTVEEYTEIQNNTISKSAIKINAGSVLFDPCNVKEGNMCTFSCLVNKLVLANASITITNVLDNKIDIVAEADKFVEIQHTFVALSSQVQIKLECDTNYCLFSDCMLSVGAEKKSWQLAAGEISNKGLNISDDEAEFFNSAINTKLTIGAAGTKIINTETGEIRTQFNANDTLVNNLTIEGTNRHGNVIHTDFGTHITTSWASDGR